MINKIKKIDFKKIDKNKTYIYSAGFNVDKYMKGKSRLYEELEDLKILIKKKVKIVLISHQGSFNKKNCIQLDFLKSFLVSKLKTKIIFLKNKKKAFDKNNLKLINKGEILVLPNIRFFKGEELNSKLLAEKMSRLGNYVIIGGFSKAHRKNSSNNAILNYLPGLLSNGIYKELKLLEPWVKPKKGSILILGGEKVEKITFGIKYLAKKYKFIIPTGLVLNTILKLKGFDIGSSYYHNGKKELLMIKRFILKSKKKILIPRTMNVYSKKDHNKKKIVEINKIKKNQVIGGFFLTELMEQKIKNCLKNQNHILIAGTPCLVSKKFLNPSNKILSLIKNKNKKALLLGGDTVSDLKFSGKKSSGGGSAMNFLSNKPLPILTSLYKNQMKYNVI